MFMTLIAIFLNLTFILILFYYLVYIIYIALNLNVVLDMILLNLIKNILSVKKI